MRTSSDQLLRAALRTDAVCCAVFSVGVLAILLNKDSWLAELDVSLGLIVAAGLLALIGVPSLWALSLRRKIEKKHVWLVIASNFAWGIVCIVALAAGWVQPSKVGAIVIVSQSVITAAIAEIEWWGLRRVAAPTPLA